MVRRTKYWTLNPIISIMKERSQKSIPMAFFAEMRKRVPKVWSMSSIMTAIKDSEKQSGIDLKDHIKGFKYIAYEDGQEELQEIYSEAYVKKLYALNIILRSSWHHKIALMSKTEDEYDMNTDSDVYRSLSHLGLHPSAVLDLLGGDWKIKLHTGLMSWIRKSPGFQETKNEGEEK